ncbi:hypothetical protein BDR03DRAFT_1002229 [Suillus americanus]|nr:hypothetical protein BDR03DRAFT_1002229 [Suillus americanus]
MSSIYHEVLGSFADVPAVIRVNGASPDSTVSLSFLHSSNVPRSIFNHEGVAVESSSGPARVPTVDVFQGALYDPRILPDYRGSYFELRQNKLKQLNIFDTPENNCKLVPMHETYAKLRPGTLVLAVCDAHVYNIVQNGLPTSTFQLGVQAIKILDPSDELVEERFIPILSPTSTDMSKDNSAVASFSTFDVATSPAKKSKHAKGGKGKEKMD